MKRVRKAWIFGLFIVVSAQSQAKEIDVMEGKYAFETCRGCHSAPNYSNVYPTYYVPKIGGQRKEYIASALEAYRNGVRPHGPMFANAYDLTDKVTEAMALYVETFAAKKSKAPHTAGNPHQGEVLAKACLSCHTSDLGDGLLAPILAGQHENYLVKAMKEYQSGKRKDPLMQSMLAAFSAEDLDNLAAYFAQLEGLSIVK